MNKFEAEIWERLGGIDAAIKWLKGKRSAFYGPLFSKMTATDLQPHVASNSEEELWAVIERALFGAVGALYSKADNGRSGVRDAVSSDAGAAHDAASNPATISTPLGNSNHGIIDTPGHDIAKTLAAQRQLQESNPSDGVTKPSRPDIHRDRYGQPIVGLYTVDSVLGSDGRSTTQKYLDWVNNGGGRWSGF